MRQPHAISYREVIRAVPFEDPRFVVCMPACDEEEGVSESIESLLACLPVHDAVVVVVNGSRDRTALIAENILSATSHPFVLIDLQWQKGCGSAPEARRIALDRGAELAPNGFLVSFDADTHPAPDLRSAYEAEFGDGADLVCGAIDFDPEEAALLPPGDPDLEYVVREYRTASREIAALIDPDPHNPWPHHGNIGGANFAIRTQTYRAIGGLPTPAFGEDRALLRLVEAHGLRVRFSERARATTSCRLTGKAPGGLADELRRSRLEADPIMDEALEPARALELRLRCRAAFRKSSDDEARRLSLAPLGLTAEELAAVFAAGRPGEMWQGAEAASVKLRRTRMRRSDLRCELPALIALRDRLRSAADDRS